MKMPVCLTLLVCLLSLLLQAQTDSTFNLEASRKEYRKLQHELDMNYSGMGFSLYKPALGKITTIDRPWVDINLVSDIIELRFGFGSAITDGYTKSVIESFGPEYVYADAVGYNAYAGLNFPVKFLCFGQQSTTFNVMRGHFTASGGLGMMNFAHRDYGTKSIAKLFYLGLSPGYRVRTPLGSVEANLNFRIGLTGGSESDLYKGSGIYPSLTFRFDALKWKYSSNMVSVKVTAAHVTNATSTTTYNGSTYTSTARIDHYTTTYSGDVHVSEFNAGILDIGPHIGIGPKFTFSSPRRNSHISPGRLFGVVAEGRFSMLDLGLTLEGGTVGHGGELIVKDDEENTFRKKLNRQHDEGLGTMKTFNCYTQIGMDVTSGVLALLGMVMDKGDATSFFAFTAGINVGVHASWDQQFVNPTDAQVYADKITFDEKGTKPKYLDPSACKAGYLGGFYFSAQAGAMCFKITNYRYYGAPFASTTMFSVAYRFPLVRK